MTPVRPVQSADEWPPNRDGWGPGPWDSEPDRLQWLSVAAGRSFPCMILRNHVGALCGYVGVPPEHPFRAQPSADWPVRVHGGITWARESAIAGLFSIDPEVFAAQDPKGAVLMALQGGVLWVGFDCSHAGDLSPHLNALVKQGVPFNPEDVYRDLAYVHRQVERLAAQLREVWAR